VSARAVPDLDRRRRAAQRHDDPVHEL